MERIVADLLRTTLDAMPGDGTVELTAEQKGEAAAVTVSTAAGVSEIGRPGRLAGIHEALRPCNGPEDHDAGGDRPDEGGRGPTANRLGLATTISRVRPHGGEITTPFTRGNASPFAILQPTRSPPMKPSK